MSRLNLGAITAYAIAKKHGFEGTEEEWLESLKGKDGEGGSDLDAQINGTSIVEEVDGKKVAKIPIAGTSSKLGVVWAQYIPCGLYILPSGEIRVYGASQAWIDQRGTDANNLHKPIVTKELDYAVMSSLTNPLTHTWTDDQKSQAQATLGLDNKLNAPTIPTAGLGLVAVSKNTGAVVYKLLEEQASARGGWIPLYLSPSVGNNKPNGNGRLVSQEPEQPYQLANKKYVDEHSGTQLYKHDLIINKNEYGSYELIFISTQSTAFTNVQTALDSIFESDLEGLAKGYSYSTDVDINGQTYYKPSDIYIGFTKNIGSPPFDFCTTLVGGSEEQRFTNLSTIFPSDGTIEEYAPIPL